MLETFVIFLLFLFWNFVDDSLKCIVLEWNWACCVTSRSPTTRAVSLLLESNSFHIFVI